MTYEGWSTGELFHEYRRTGYDELLNAAVNQFMKFYDSSKPLLPQIVKLVEIEHHNPIREAENMSIMGIFKNRVNDVLKVESVAGERFELSTVTLDHYVGDIK